MERETWKDDHTLEDSVKSQLWAGSDDSGTKTILKSRYNKCNILEQTFWTDLIPTSASWKF